MIQKEDVKRQEKTGEGWRGKMKREDRRMEKEKERKNES